MLEVPKGFEQKGWSDCEIDGERLADDISKSICKLEADGFEFVSISNINSAVINLITLIQIGQAMGGLWF
ncbi:hypothetical protein [Pseudoalteromonas prydzensis]|jgi:hypothetical protein|uniref:hypothetical protein n=1 Tax=Pseudoalteromonas prydzensis TaxID=182141 RepID=UPI0024BC1FAE|nr:hypothetical protein [Pseudoalteromonas prydzensis]